MYMEISSESYECECFMSIDVLNPKRSCVVGAAQNNHKGDGTLSKVALHGVR